MGSDGDLGGQVQPRAISASARAADKGWQSYHEMRAERDALRQSHVDCDRTYADMTDALERLGAELAGLPEWRCPGCGAVTRARMADHPTDTENRPPRP